MVWNAPWKVIMGGLYAKRDDLGLLGGGGNKLRKLEFLAAEAMAHGADTLIAIGGLPSNFAHLTAGNTLDKANATLRWLGAAADLQTHDLNISDAQLGAGYGLPTPAMQAAVSLMARNEGLLLDPVYSGKAFAGLLEDVRSGYYPAGSHVLFIMTGGSPGLFGYGPE